jgi:diadenosine tetraphosphatase ApaH/serine/threonine PP2A family protein phosphatase
MRGHFGERDVQLSQRLARFPFDVRELGRDRFLDVCHYGTSMPETEDETVERVLDGVVAAIDRQQ